MADYHKSMLGFCQTLGSLKLRRLLWGSGFRGLGFSMGFRGFRGLGFGSLGGIKGCVQSPV